MPISMQHTSSWKNIKTILVKKFPEYSRTHRLFAVFKTVRRQCLYWSRWVQYTISLPVSLRSFLILSSHLCLGCPSSPSPSCFPRKKHPYLFLQIPHPSLSPWKIRIASSAFKVYACRNSSYRRVRGRCVSIAEHYLATSQAHTSCTTVTVKYKL